MGRIIVVTGLGGIAGITALAYWMLYRRIIENCMIGPRTACIPDHQAELDRIVLVGLSVALAYAIVCLCVAAIVRTRRGDRPIKAPYIWSRNSRGNPPRLP